MCLAVPMRIINITGNADDILSQPTALVESDGIQKDVRLDIVDRWPQVGDFVIIHAGFAIHTLDPQEAKTNLQLLQEMANGTHGPDQGQA